MSRQVYKYFNARACQRGWLKTIWLLCVCVCAGAARTTAQYRFDSWTTDNGLPQISINSILQTRDGFLWLTTFGGLVRYDGLRFQVFNTGNTKGLRTSRFTRMVEDREGNLWINTEGQGLTRYKDEVFKTYTAQDGLPGNLISNIFEDAAGVMRFGNENGMVQWKDGSFMPAAPAPGEPTVTSRSYRTRTGAIWYLDASGLLHKFENGRNTADLSTGFDVRIMYEDLEGRLWIGTAEKRLLMFHNDQLKIYSEREGFPPFWLNTFFEDRRGQLWFGLRGGGLLRYKDGEFTQYTTADGLVGNDVINIYQDREGTFWIGTTAGLSRLTERAVTGYSKKDGLAADNVYPIYEDRQGQIWIGSWNGLTRYAGGVFKDFGQQYDVQDAQVTSLLEDKEGGLWIGTWGHGVRYVRNGKVTTFASSAQPGTLVRSIIQDRSGNIWFGNSTGVVKYRDGAFTAYGTGDGLVGKETSVIYEDRRGTLWIGNDSGLMKYENGVFTASLESEGFAGGIVRAVFEDETGALWVGTYDSGLYRLKDGRFTHYTARDGLFDNGVFSIVDDGRGNFWISCNLGIYRLRKIDLVDFAGGRIKEVTSVPYNKRDGMPNSECNGGGQPAGVRARDGHLWFPTQGGVAVINPESVPVNLEPPQVVIGSAIVDTQAVSLHSGLRLEPGQVNLEINYAGLSYINPELVKFRYKLEGLDDDWVDAGGRRTAYYSHLPPGTYSFKVIAANRDGVWNQEGASIPITVVPPFWRTWWFASLVVILLTFGATILYRRRIAQLKRARRMQETFSNQLIESQEAERKRIAAELHDSIGQSLIIIKNRAYLGLNGSTDSGAAREQLEEITASVTDALQEVREISSYLRPSQLERLGLTTTLEEMLERVATSSDINFSHSVAQLEGALSPRDEINFYRVVQESISNIIKHSEATEASIIVSRENGVVRLTVSDNGKGFVPDGSVSANGGARRGGFGLTGMAERVRMTGGYYEINSAVGVGTTITVIINT